MLAHKDSVSTFEPCFSCPGCHSFAANSEFTVGFCIRAKPTNKNDRPEMVVCSVVSGELSHETAYLCHGGKNADENVVVRG